MTFAGPADPIYTRNECCLHGLVVSQRENVSIILMRQCEMQRNFVKVVFLYLLRINDYIWGRVLTDKQTDENFDPVFFFA